MQERAGSCRGKKAGSAFRQGQPALRWDRQPSRCLLRSRVLELGRARQRPGRWSSTCSQARAGIPWPDPAAGPACGGRWPASSARRARGRGALRPPACTIPGGALSPRQREAIALYLGGRRGPAPVTQGATGHLLRAQAILHESFSLHDEVVVPVNEPLDVAPEVLPVGVPPERLRGTWSGGAAPGMLGGTPPGTGPVRRTGTVLEGTGPWSHPACSQTQGGPGLPADMPASADRGIAFRAWLNSGTCPLVRAPAKVAD